MTNTERVIKGIVLILFFSLIGTIIFDYTRMDNSESENLSGRDYITYIQNSKLNEQEELETITEPHWNHLPLRYKINDYCKTREGNIDEDIRAGIKYIEDETVLSFVEVDSGEDILYNCNPELLKTAPELTIAEAETIKYGNTYSYGTIYYYHGYQCKGIAPTLWIHETLHLVGIPDKVKSDWLDIMWTDEASKENCKKVKIVDEDKLYFENIYGGVN